MEGAQGHRTIGDVVHQGLQDTVKGFKASLGEGSLIVKGFEKLGEGIRSVGGKIGDKLSAAKERLSEAGVKDALKKVARGAGKVLKFGAKLVVSLLGAVAAAALLLLLLLPIVILAGAGGGSGINLNLGSGGSGDSFKQWTSWLCK